MRWPRYSLRSIGVATALIAIVLAYLGAQWRSYRQQLFVAQQVEAIDGGTWYGPREGLHVVEVYTGHLSNQFTPSFARYLMGEGPQIQEIDFTDLDYVPPSLLKEIGKLPDLQSLLVTPIVSRTPEVQAIIRKEGIKVSIVENRDQFVEVIDTPEEFQQGITDSNVVLFLDCDWSVSAVLTRRRHSLLASHWQNEHRNSQSKRPNARFLRVDLNDTKTSLWAALQTWQREKGIERSGMKNLGGAGRVFWLREGKLVRYDPTLAEVPVFEVMQRTEEAFAASAQK